MPLGGAYHPAMRTLWKLLAACGIALALAGPAWAELPQNPGGPKTQAKMIIYGSYIAVGVLLGAVCTAAFKPAKRGHQD